ncbi:MAG TPA: aldehyde dehydrogenase family protein [Amycolatopsis sp.]|nr:aldehyde dehydrogenase family protein [Amycolatopsis sp.]
MTTNPSLFIDGAWAQPHTAATIDVCSARTGQPLGSAVSGTREDVDRTVGAARQAFDKPGGWAEWPASDRAAALERLAEALGRRAEQTVRLVSEQNGMPISVSRQIEGQFPGALLQYYAGLVREQGTETSQAGLFGGTTRVRREPAGVVAAIAPWNFPQTLAAQKYAPALAAGCSVVLKPAPETVLDTAAVGHAAQEAGLPPGVLNIVPAEADVSSYLVGHPGIDAVAFTGSTAIGKRIAAVCGPLVRPVTLELGGRSAAVILDDADLDLGHAGEALYGSMIINNGQTCFLSTRILAPRSRYREVVDTLAAFASSLVVGDPLDPATQIGPLVTERRRDEVAAAVEKDSPTARASSPVAAGPQA